MTLPSGDSANLGNGYRAILFDLDGTLIDSLPALAASINAILREDGRRAVSLPEVRDMVGDGIKVLVARAYAATGVPPGGDAALRALVERFSAHYDPDPTAGCAPYANAAVILGGLAAMGYRLGVVTNKPEGPARAILERFALAPVLEIVVGGDTTDHLKPHPEPFLHAADRLETSPQHVIMVGDSHNDVEGARRAGMAAILVSYGYAHGPIADMNADAVIDELADLPDAVRALPTVEA